MKKNMNKLIGGLLLGMLGAGCVNVQSDNRMPFMSTLAEDVPAAETDPSGYEKAQVARGTSEIMLHHTGFTVSYNVKTYCPNYVTWELTEEETRGRVSREGRAYTPDSLLPEKHRVTTFDYSRSGYDRGHMCPAGDMWWSEEGMNDCFLMTNFCPQDHTLNSESWRTLEEACRRWARREGALLITCGPIFGDEPKRIGRKGVAVPEAFFKVVMSVRPGHEKAIGFIYENTSLPQKMEDVAVSVDEVEKITGIDFFCTVPKDLQKRLEQEKDFSAWR